jgi:anti-sigma-K factor RskA
MIDERHEELASLYALDLLEGADRVQFETALARDPELQALVRELRDASATLVHTAPAAEPPAALKARVLRSVEKLPAAAPVADNVIRPAFGVWRIIPWAAAACLALGLAWVGQRYASTQAEIIALRQAREAAEISRQSSQQQLEAERILNQHRFQNAEQQLATTNTQLGEARTQLAERDRLLAEVRLRLTERDRQLADNRSLLTDRERQVATLTQRIESLASEMKAQGDFANLQIAALTSALTSSDARAVAVWDPVRQEGMLTFEKVPTLAADQKLELWVVDVKDGVQKPISAGVLNVSLDGNAKVRIKPTARVINAAAIAISREKNDGASSHATPGEVIMVGPSR